MLKLYTKRFFLAAMLSSAGLGLWSTAFASEDLPHVSGKAPHSSPVYGGPLSRQNRMEPLGGNESYKPTVYLGQVFVPGYGLVTLYAPGKPQGSHTTIGITKHYLMVLPVRW